MRLASFTANGGATFGIVVQDGVVDARRWLGGRFETLRSTLEAPDGVAALRALSQRAPDYEFSAVTWLPVIPRPRAVWAIGINYRAHSEETGLAAQKNPTTFLRTDRTLLGAGQPMRCPKLSTNFDYEGELAVIMGKAGRHIPIERALEHVAGYSIFNDGSVRDFQLRDSLNAGKNFDDTGPFGPWMVTSEEIPDPSKLTLSTRLNGLQVQHATTDTMIHSVPELIAYISQITRFEPGDVISTGTPAGVGLGRNPPLWMKPGDVVEVEISGEACCAAPWLRRSRRHDGPDTPRCAYGGRHDCTGLAHDSQESAPAG